MALSDTKSGLYLCKIFMRGLRVAASPGAEPFGNQAISLSERMEPDLVLSGVTRPDKNGIEFAAELR